MWILIYIIVCFILAAYGEKRKIGFWGTLIVSALLSPIIGFMCVALSERKQNDNNNDRDFNSGSHKDAGFDIERYRSN